MREVIGCSICLNGQLQLCDYLIIYHDLQGYITNRRGFSESIFDLLYSKLGVILDKFLNLIDNLNNLPNL